MDTESGPPKNRYMIITIVVLLALIVNLAVWLIYLY